ncbi:hypothetical protein BDZ89DRAFT_812829 [Hymenopellis radicata]|nr:hypothetical protein BDZ89DRAFT_812829 [Hymenopellis radicata]
MRYPSIAHHSTKRLDLLWRFSGLSYVHHGGSCSTNTFVASQAASAKVSSLDRIHEFSDFLRKYNPRHAIYTWKEPNGGMQELSNLEFSRAVHRACHALKHLDVDSPIRVLALCDTIVHHAVFGLMKAGNVGRTFMNSACLSNITGQCLGAC